MYPSNFKAATDFFHLNQIKKFIKFIAAKFASKYYLPKSGNLRTIERFWYTFYLKNLIEFQTKIRFSEKIE